MENHLRPKGRRKRIGLIAIIIISLIIIAFVTLFLYLHQLSSSGQPLYNGQIEIPGLIEPVEVFRDKFGVPHIFARHETDLYLATGYVMAQDRLWQMDLIRRLTSGRLSEIFGPRLVETDLLFRALRIPDKARRVLAATPIDVLQAVKAFSEGVNAFIQTHRHRLPLEFRLLRYQPEPWTPEHSACLIGYIGWDLAFAWGIETLMWTLQEKLREQEEKLAEILAEPMNPIYVFPHFSLNPSPEENKPKLRLAALAKNHFLLPTPYFLAINENRAVYPKGSDEFNQREEDQNAKFSSNQLEILTSTSQITLMKAIKPLADLGLIFTMNSNNWAVGPEKSQTGKPLLANDMHLSLNLPSIWYPLHQALAGKFRVSGVALPGEPFIVAGHNEFIAWGMTNVMADDIDFYLEKINPENPDQYLWGGKWQSLEIKEEKIKVKGRKEISRQLRFTHRGPIISSFKEIKDRQISMRWMGFEESNELLAVYLLNRAQNWTEFRQALRFFRSLSLNVIYADIEGNIGLQLAGGIPKRPRPTWALFPGELVSSDWSGIITFEDLPFAFNPEENFVISANNKSVSDNYPYTISYFFLSPVRAERIREFLMSKEKLTREDMAKLQSDDRSKLVARLKSPLMKILANLRPQSELESKALELLKNWDGTMDISSSAATLFEILYFELARQMMTDELGETFSRSFISFSSNVFLPAFLERALTTGNSTWTDDLTTPDRLEKIEEIVERSFRQTINYLINMAGEDMNNWRWGHHHRLIFRHPLGEVSLLNFLFKLNRGPYPVGGSFHTVCAFGYLSDSFKVRHGPSQRHVYDLSNFDESLTILPGGVSGLPSSVHYDDQISLYVKGKYRPTFFSDEKIKNSARYRLRLIPVSSKLNENLPQTKNKRRG